MATMMVTVIFPASATLSEKTFSFPVDSTIEEALKQIADNSRGIISVSHCGLYIKGVGFLDPSKTLESYESAFKKTNGRVHLKEKSSGPTFSHGVLTGIFLGVVGTLLYLKKQDKL